MYESVCNIIGVEHKIGMAKRLAVMIRMRTVPPVVLPTHKQSAGGRNVDDTKSYFAWEIRNLVTKNYLLTSKYFCEIMNMMCNKDRNMA
jgi:hypothetical protein